MFLQYQRTSEADLSQRAGFRFQHFLIFKLGK